LRAFIRNEAKEAPGPEEGNRILRPMQVGRPFQPAFEILRIGGRQLMMFLEERIDLCEVARMMFDRYLTNAAGGNITVKVSEELFLMTPTLMSQAKFCRLTPEDILVVDKHGNIYEGKGKLTREFNMHMAAYEALPEAGAVIHGHAKESMVFASLGMQMPNLTEATQKLGDIATLEFAPATTKELAKIVREHLLSRNGQLPVAALLNKHGVIVVDRTLRKAYDMFERLEYNAYVGIHAKIFSALGLYKEERKAYNYNLEE